MSDPESLPQNANYIFVQAPLALDKLKAILDGIESTAVEHPVDDTYPTNSWVTHVYAAVTDTNRHGYAILYDIPPVNGATALQAATVTGQDEKEKAESASILIGHGNELIGYEDLDGLQRVVIFRATPGAAPAPNVPNTLSWDTADHPERQAWSTRLIDLTKGRRVDLEQGRPEIFIPGYNGLPSAALKTKFWAELIVAMAKFESGWNPTNVFNEPPPLTEKSIGLLQLSLGDQNNYTLNPHIQSENELKKPLLNLEWGVTIFAHWLAKDGIVASGAGNNSRGAARYWSVLRTGHKIDLIKALTKKNVGL
jgi:hypothetical protein